MPPRIKPSTGRLLPAILLVATVLAGCASGTAHAATAPAPAGSRPAPSTPVPTAASASATAPPSAGVVVIGASVSGGYRASPDTAWPTGLATRLQQAHEPVTVVNASISATRLLADNGPGVPNSLAREDKDALDVPGVRTIVLTDLINDIQQPPPHQCNPDAITAGIKEFTTRAHARHVEVIATTIPPYGGYIRYEDTGARTRQSVNQFIRHDRVLDGYIDFDTALKDPADPTRLRSDYDSDDHLHLNDAGQRAIAQSINLKLLTPAHGYGHARLYTWTALASLPCLALGALLLIRRRKRHRHRH